MHFVKLNNLPLLEVLITHFKGRVSINNELRDKNGKSLLHLAVQPNKFGWIQNVHILSALLKNKIGDLQAVDSEGRTPLDLACEIKAMEH